MGFLDKIKSMQSKFSAEKKQTGNAAASFC